MCSYVIRLLTVFVCLLVPRLCAAEWLYALTGDAVNGHVLRTFDLAQPGIQRYAVAIHGIASSETLRAIDVRPRDGQLYGLATAPSGPAFFGVRLYRIHPITGAATLVGDPATFLPMDASSEIGFDFDAGGDRLPNP